MPHPRILADRRFAWDVRELDVAVDLLPHRDDQEMVGSDGRKCVRSRSVRCCAVASKSNSRQIATCQLGRRQAELGKR
jgi:hypothetical protein